jgi:hypothetical protein
MMARSSRAPSIGRIQKRKTNFLQIIIFGLQRAAGPYRWANEKGPMRDIRFSLDDLVGYSITLSARTNNASGTVTPIALAVLD